MKKIAFFLLFTVHLAQAQKFTVARVVGTVFGSSGDSLFVGKDVVLGETLRFVGNSSLVLMQGKQRFNLIRDKDIVSLSKANLKAIVRSSLGKAKARGSAPMGFNSLIDYFGDDKFAVIGEQIQVPIKSEEIVLSQDQMVVYRFKYGNDVVQKPIVNDSNRLLFQKKSILSHKSELIEASLIKEPKLFYFDKSKKESKELVRFHLDFLEEEALKRDLRKLVANSNEFKALNGDALLEELCVFFFDVYGKTDLNTLRIWLKQNVASK